MLTSCPPGDFVSVTPGRSGSNVQFNTYLTNPIITNATLSGEVLTITFDDSVINNGVIIKGIAFAAGSGARNRPITFENGYGITTPGDSLGYGNNADSTSISTSTTLTKNTFTISGIVQNVCLGLNIYLAYNTNTLVAENIKEGIIINGVTGTAVAENFKGNIALFNRPYESGGSSPAWLSTGEMVVTPSGLTGATPTFTITSNFNSLYYCTTGESYNLTANSFSETVTKANGSKKLSGNYTGMTVVMNQTAFPATLFIASFNN